MSLVGGGVRGQDREWHLLTLACAAQRNTRIATLVAPTLFLGLIFASTSLPVYSGLPLAIGLFFLMHHVRHLGAHVSPGP